MQGRNSDVSPGDRQLGCDTGLQPVTQRMMHADCLSFHCTRSTKNSQKKDHREMKTTVFKQEVITASLYI
jgi:hypothetical protein